MSYRQTFLKWNTSSKNQEGMSDTKPYYKLSYQDGTFFKTMNSHRRPSTEHFIQRTSTNNLMSRQMMTDMENNQSLVKFGHFFSSRNKAAKRATSIPSTRSKSNTKQT